MGITARFQQWSHTHESFLLLAARIILGLILLAKGLFFISNSQHLKELILESRFATGVGFLVGYITFGHLFGGVFIILGLLTRVAVILQLPVLLGALLFILPKQVSGAGTEYFLSIIVLALLVVVLIKGSGRISMDAYLKEHLL